MKRLSTQMKAQLANVEDACRRHKSVPSLWNEIQHIILDAVPGDLGMFCVADPVTGLFVDGYAYGAHRQDADTYIAQFYLKHEHYSFLDLRADGGIVAHSLCSEKGWLHREPLYGEWLGPLGFRHGVRSAFVSGGYYWGGLSMMRGGDTSDFTVSELGFLQSIAEPVGEALRVALMWRRAHEASSGKEVDVDGAREIDGTEPCDSAVLLLDRQHRVLFQTVGARSILEDISPKDSTKGLDYIYKVGGPLPGVLHAVAAKLSLARSKAQFANNPRVSIKGRARRWTVTATSPEPGMSEEVATVLIVAQSHPRDAAPALLAAYGLTDREQQVVQCVRLGMSNAAIAQRLFLSRYTVQDHLKRIFSKVGVSSRGELMAIIFREESPLNPT